MNDQTSEHRGIEPILNAIANWVKSYRHAVGLRGELANCGPEEVERMARDVGVGPDELRLYVNKGPHAADELPKLLRALGVDPQRLASESPEKMRGLQRLCITCSDKDQCRRDMAAGTIATHYREYCPNAMSIEAIFRAESNTGRSRA
jgi:hypothetical protein